MTTIAPPIRWPWGDLEHALRAAGYPSARAAAKALGVNIRQVHRWINEGLSDPMADRCAITLGTHPACIWTHWHTGSPDGVTSPLMQDDVA